MRWQTLMALAAVFIASFALFTTTGPATPTASANDVAVDLQSDFALNLLLSQSDRTMTVSLRDGEPFAMGVYEISVSYVSGDVPLSVTTLHPFVLDAFGQHQIVMPLQFDNVLTNFEMHISASHDSTTGGSPVSVQMPWRFGSMYVSDFSDIEDISPVAFAALGGVGGDVALDDSGPNTLSLLALAEGSPPSFAFASQITAADGSFVLTGAGNYMAVGPPLQFGLTSGPTGVFTAN
jgi:hypothetical protein